MHKLVLPVAALCLGGCVATSELGKAELEAGAASPAVKAAIVEGARSYMEEPYILRAAEISTMPFDALRNRHYVCVRADAADARGNDLGRKAMAVFVRDGRPVATSLNDPLCARAGLRWEPFPELDALQRS